MRSSKLRGLVLSIACATMLSLLSAPAFGDNFIMVDENGHGTFNGAALPETVFMEPISGQATLVYSIFIGGAPFASGDVLINDPGGANSDLLRFNGSTVPALYVFSTRGGGALADTGLPAVFTPLTFTEASFGPGVTGLIYTPAPGQPGYFGTGVTYDFVSSVPEPASWVLLTAPLLVLGLLRRRRST